MKVESLKCVCQASKHIAETDSRSDNIDNMKEPCDGNDDAATHLDADTCKAVIYILMKAVTKSPELPKESCDMITNTLFHSFEINDRNSEGEDADDSDSEPEECRLGNESRVLGSTFGLV